MRRFLTVVGISLLLATPTQAHKPDKCVSERNTALKFAGQLKESLGASVFDGNGVLYISRDLDLNGIGDVLQYLDKRFLPLVEKTNQMWAKHLLCILDEHKKEAAKKIEKAIGEEIRRDSCNPLLHAWTLCLRDEPIN